MKSLCVDLGGTRIKLAAVEDGAVGDCEVFPTAADFAETRAELERRIAAILAREPAGWCGLGISTPGLVDEAAGCVRHIGGKHRGLVDYDLKAWARRHFNLEAAVLNDARAALLGETAYGCACGERNAVIVTLGTGVGTAALVEGRLIGGCHDSFGLLSGHIPVKMDGRACLCGGRGCFEAYVGTWALKEMTGDPAYDYRRLEEDLRRGEAGARGLFAVVAEALGTGTLMLIHAYDAEAVVFSGGASRFAALLEAAKAYVRAHAYTPWGEVRFSVAADPEASGLLGLHAVLTRAAQSRKDFPC